MSNNRENIQNNIARDNEGMVSRLKRSVHSGLFFGSIAGMTSSVGSGIAGALISYSTVNKTKQAIASVLNCCWGTFCQGGDYLTTISCNDYLEAHTHLIFRCMKELTNSSAEAMCKAGTTSTSSVVSSVLVTPLIVGATTAAVTGFFGYLNSSKKSQVQTQLDNEALVEDTEDTPLLPNNNLGS